jgi:hypothetical protein
VAPPAHSEPTQVDLEESFFDPRPEDDGSPGRMIAIMVGIVGILLLGSLFWSAVGALFGALGAASEALPVGRSATVVLPAPTAAVQAAPTPTALVVVQRPAPAPTPAPTQEPTPEAQPSPTPSSDTAGRAPWIVLPQPAPGSTVSPGSLTIEARGRGDAAITEIRLELDGAALGATLEQRSETTWRGSASARVGAGQHSARATVVDAKGRTGSFRWSFEAAP